MGDNIFTPDFENFTNPPPQVNSTKGVDASKQMQATAKNKKKKKAKTLSDVAESSKSDTLLVRRDDANLDDGFDPVLERVLRESIMTASGSSTASSSTITAQKKKLVAEPSVSKVAAIEKLKKKKVAAPVPIVPAKPIVTKITPELVTSVHDGQLTSELDDAKKRIQDLEAENNTLKSQLMLQEEIKEQRRAALRQELSRLNWLLGTDGTSPQDFHEHILRVETQLMKFNSDIHELDKFADEGLSRITSLEETFLKLFNRYNGS